MSLENYTLDRNIARRVNPYIGISVQDTQSNCIAAMEQIAFFVSDHEMQSVNGALMRMLLAISAALTYESMPTHLGAENTRDEGLIPKSVNPFHPGMALDPANPAYIGVIAGIGRAERNLRVGDGNKSPIA